VFLVGRFRGALCVAALALALLIAPAAASAVNPVGFSQVGDLTHVREYPGAALMPDGRVLVVGGYDDAGLGTYLNSAEVFNPKTGTFSALGATMSSGRYAPAVASLPDGRVLVAGGYDKTSDVASAQVFTPSTGAFSTIGSLGTPRDSAFVARLPDGRILVGGGYSNGDTLDSSEIFNPQTNSFSPGPTVPVQTSGSTAAAIAGGRILVAGGYDGADNLASTFVFDPSNNVFTPTSPLSARTYAPAGASLPQGRALIAGGQAGASSEQVTTAQVFDPAANSFSQIGGLVHKREEAAAVELKDGRVLVAGGWADNQSLGTAEVLSVPSNSFSSKLKGRKVKFKVSTEGVAQVTDVSTKVATTAEKKKKKPKFVKTSKKHGGPGTIVVKIKLSKQGSAQLRRKGKLKVRVAYTPDGGVTATKKLKLRAGE
jgi:hypothetical protein